MSHVKGKNVILKRYPMKMAPYYQDYLWGGDMLFRQYGKISGHKITAESWELSAHEAGQSIIDNGLYAGKAFGAWIQANMEAVGTRFHGGRFPTLIKFLDVHSMLSVQVHPSDTMALAEKGEQGKAEVWYIVEAKPGARIYFGLENEITHAEFMKRAANGTVCDVLHCEEAKSGQIWFITPGTLHSAAGGVLIAEIQQSSDTTLRAYDFNRLDANGRYRPLQLSRVCAVMNTRPIQNEAQRQNETYETIDFTFSSLFACAYFRLSRLRIYRRMELLCEEDSFHALLTIHGNAVLEYAGLFYPLKAGDCYFIPANMGKYDIIGEAECLLTRL